MSSSIFSSEKTYQSRFIIFGISLILMLFIVGGINYYLLTTVEKRIFEEKMMDTRFWQEKIKPSPLYAVVFMGDSRTYRGVNPSIVSRILKLKCYNLGFSAGGLNQEIFQLAETKLNPVSPQTVIVLGISPYTLCEEARGNRQYKSLLTQQQNFHEEQRLIVQTFFTPVKHERWHEIRMDLKQTKKMLTYWDSGWTSTEHRYSQEEYEKGLKIYRVKAQEYVLSLKSLEDVTTAVKNWSKRGFYVFAYRPPTSKEMVEIENTSYNENRVRNAFKDAGGIWLNFPNESYQTYDASHLTTESSRKFSHDLANKIHEHLTGIKH